MNTLVEMNGSMRRFLNIGRCLLLPILLLFLLSEEVLKLLLNAINFICVSLDGFVVVLSYLVTFSLVLSVENVWRVCDELSCLNIDRLLKYLCLVL